MLSELLKMHKDDLDRYKNHPEHHAMYKIEWGIYYARQIRDCFISENYFDSFAFSFTVIFLINFICFSIE